MLRATATDMERQVGKMSRKEEYEQKAEAMLAPIVESNGFELVDVESVSYTHLTLPTILRV